ncbi:MAG: O-antigen ligase family protein, partial [Gaiellales bacterium]
QKKHRRDGADEGGTGSQGSRVRLIGLILICAYVALVPVVFDHGADAPFPVAKGLLAHSLAYVLAAVLIGIAIVHGRRGWVWSWLHVPVLAFIAANLIATLFAPDLYVALFGTHRRMLGLGTVTAYVVLYFGIALLVRTRREAVAVVTSALIGSAVVLGYEVVQLARRDPFEWSVDTSVRPFSTLGQTTTLAEYLTILVLGVVAIALLDERLGRTSRVGLGLYSLVLVVGVLVTQTRSAFIGLATGAAMLLLLVWTGHPSQRARLVSLAGAGATTVALALVLLFTPLGARFLSTVELPEIDVTGDDASPRLEQAAEVRVALYEIALQMVRDRPLFGYGPDNFAAALPRYRSESEPFEVQQSYATSAHGWAAQVAATTGIVGLASYVAIPVTALALTLRTRFRPIAWAAVAMLAAFLGAGLTTISDLSVDWLFWAAAGGVAAATVRPSESPDPPPPSRRKEPNSGAGEARMRSRLALATVAVGIVLAFTSTVAFSASRSARDSQLERLRVRPQQAIELAKRATASDGRRAEYWDTLGLAYVSADSFRDAAAAFERASELAPYDVRYHGDLARAYVFLIQRGDATYTTRARDVAERAVAIDPNNPLANHTRAIVMQVTGDLPEALKSVERALALDQSNNREILLTATQVLFRLGRFPDAVAMARHGITRIPNPVNQVQIRTELARALAANGQLSEALREIDAALAIQPNQPSAQQVRAQIIAALTK